MFSPTNSEQTLHLWSAGAIPTFKLSTSSSKVMSSAVPINFFSTFGDVTFLTFSKNTLNYVFELSMGTKEDFSCVNSQAFCAPQ